MPRVEIEDFDITDQTIDKIGRHAIGEGQLYEVLQHFWMVIPNRKERAAPHVLLGTDNRGNCLAIPIVPTDRPRVWKPITAWQCKPREEAILRQRSPR
jgi:hypothetical protein